MKFHQIKEGVGRIVKGVNTTPDVGPDEVKIQAAKFGNTVDKDGRPPTLSKKVKGSKTNVLFNLGMVESVEERSLTKSEKNKKEKIVKGMKKAKGDFKDRYGKDAKAVMYATATKIAKKKKKKKTNESNITRKDLKDQILQGIKVELEHTDDPKIALKIAIDHIKEDPAYYDKLKFIENKEVAQPSEIYVDMDGVLADFFGSWKKLIGKDWRQIDDIEPALQKIRDTDDFWLKIPPTKNANNLLSIIKQIKGSYNILSAPLPNDPNSEPHKREWIEKYLKSFPPNKVIITQDKAKYATQSDGTPNILIDDFGQNVAKWEAAGGVGFKHKDHKFERTARNLAAHLRQPAKETYTREELPQISRKDLKHIYYTVETIKVADIKPIQKERIKENFTRQLNRVQKGKYSPIIVDCENKIINGHHRYDIIKMLEMEEITVYKLPLYVENLVEFNKLTKKIGAGALAGAMALAPMGKAFAGDAPTDPLPNKQTSTMVQKDVGGKQDLSKIQAPVKNDFWKVTINYKGKDVNLKLPFDAGTNKKQIKQFIDDMMSQQGVKDYAVKDIDTLNKVPIDQSILKKLVQELEKRNGKQSIPYLAGMAKRAGAKPGADNAHAIAAMKAYLGK